MLDAWAFLNEFHIIMKIDAFKLSFLFLFLQFGANESRIGVVQYSGASAQEVVQLGDPNIKTLTDLKQYEILFSF